MNPSSDLSSFDHYSFSFFHTFLSTTRKYILLPRFRMEDSVAGDGYTYKINLFTGGIGYEGDSVYFLGLIIESNYA